VVLGQVCFAEIRGAATFCQLGTATSSYRPGWTKGCLCCHCALQTLASSAPTVGPLWP
jgi:hypothetical protein